MVMISCIPYFPYFLAYGLPSGCSTFKISIWSVTLCLVTNLGFAGLFAGCSHPMHYLDAYPEPYLDANPKPIFDAYPDPYLDA